MKKTLLLIMLLIGALIVQAKTIEQEALALFLPFLDQRENPKKKFIRLLGVRVDVEKLSTV